MAFLSWVLYIEGVYQMELSFFDKLGCLPYIL